MKRCWFKNVTSVCMGEYNSCVANRAFNMVHSVM